MTSSLHVHVLALEPSVTPDDLAVELGELLTALPDGTSITVVGPVGLPGIAHHHVDVPGVPGLSAPGPLAPVVRVLRGNLRSRRAWRAVTGTPGVVQSLRQADLVVVADPLGHRSGWLLARRHGIRAVTGLRTVRLAVRALGDPRAQG